MRSYSTMGVNCENVLDEWMLDEPDMEAAAVAAVYIPNILKQRLSILSIVIAIVIAWLADGVMFAQTFMMFYGIFGLIVLEQNFHAYLLGDDIFTYGRDFGALMIFGLAAQFFWLKYLWSVAGFLLLFKHRIMIMRELSKIISMNLRGWVLFGFIAMPIIIAMTNYLPK